jgi:hypothetical protein
VDCKDINIKSDMKSNYKNLKITNLFKKWKNNKDNIEI